MFFKSGQAPLYPLGVAAIIVAYGLSMITIGMYMFVCHKENTRRNARDSAAEEIVHLDTDFKDKTDKENLVCDHYTCPGSRSRVTDVKQLYSTSDTSGKLATSNPMDNRSDWQPERERSNFEVSYELWISSLYIELSAESTRNRSVLI